MDGHMGELQKAGNEAWKRIQMLEERIHLLPKFIVKVTHVATTTLYLIKDVEGDLYKEDSKILFDSLVED